MARRQEARRKWALEGWQAAMPEEDLQALEGWQAAMPEEDLQARKAAENRQAWKAAEDRVAARAAHKEVDRTENSVLVPAKTNMSGDCAG